MGWLRDWLGVKSAPGPFGVARQMPWLAVKSEGFARSYDQRVREVVLGNPVGLRCLKMVSGAVARLDIYGEGESGDAAAALIQKPRLMEAIATQILLHGNSFVRLIDDGAGAAKELLTLRPERVSVATNAKGWPTAYLYRVGSAPPARYARVDALGRQRVAHLKAMNPADDHYGLGCLEAAIGPASVHNGAGQWNKALLDNAARPSGAVIYNSGDGSSLSDEQYQRLKLQMAEQYEGAANAGRPLLLDGGLSWQALSLTPAEMDFVALKEAAARDIALAFGVPPVLIGLPGDSTYANAREAGRALYRQTILPLAATILDGLSEMLSGWVGAVRLKVDEDRLSELAEDRAALWTQLESASFLSDDEKRAQLGFAPRGGE